MKQIHFPPNLKEGDKIAVISPAGTVRADQLRSGIEMIEQKGFVPVTAPNICTKYERGYDYAGTEKERISDMNWALNDSGISAIWASRGGYGCQHLIQHLDLENFRKKPKWYIGYSDNTVLQSFLFQNGFASIHGQTIKTSDFGVSEDSYNLIFNALQGELPNYIIPAHPLNRTGSASGRLIGGNLALVYALLGTPYLFPLQNAILFIEEVGERYYSLDRMLMSLELAGVFSKIAGVIIGGMTQMGEEKKNPSYNESFDPFAYEIIAERLRNYGFPVAFGFPNGHIFDNKPLIIGAEVNLKVAEKVKITFN